MCIPIYIVNYRRPEYLFGTLDHFNKMTVFPNDLIVGSSSSHINANVQNETNMVLRKLIRRGALEKVFHHKCNKILENRDELILNYKPNNEYMVISDDDILVPHYWLSQLVGLMTKYKEFGILTTNLSDVDLPDPNNPLTPKRKRNEMIWADQKIYDGEINEIETASGLVIIRTELYKKIGKFYRDQWFSEEVRKQGYKVGIAKHIFARHLGQNYFYDYPSYIQAGLKI